MTVPFFTNPTANIWKILLPQTGKSARKWAIFYPPVEESADAPSLWDNLSEFKDCRILLNPWPRVSSGNYHNEVHDVSKDV